MDTQKPKPCVNLKSFKYGYIVRDLRKSRKMSQLDLEIRTGLAVGSISRIESEKINPTKETLIKISVALNLRKDEVLKLFCIDVFV
jgi:transcriptional regulator with XRE-family HTH domain